jgi:hypothetical protein
VGIPITAMSVGGATADGEPFLGLGMQIPQRHPGFTARVDKERLERFQLERFSADFVLREGTPPFEHVQVGGNPPDFLVQTFDGRSEQVDLAALPLQDWRTASRLFQQLLEKLQCGAPGHDLSNLAGCDVDVSFNQLAGLPPKKTDSTLVEPLLHAMSEIRIDWEVWRTYNAKLQSGPPAVGDQVPTGYMGTTTTPDEEAMLTVNGVVDPLTPGVPPNGPVNVQFNMTMQFTATEALALMQRLVTQHDKPQIDHLIIHVGAPDVDGWWYPAEEILARFVLERADVAVQATHMERVTVHLWQPAELVDIPVRSLVDSAGR